MNTLFDTLRINYIILEEGQQEVTVDAVVTQENETIETKILMDLTDLNRLFAKLNAKGADVSLSENFSCYQTENGNLYTLDMEDYGWESIQIEEFYPIHNVRQIRA